MLIGYMPYLELKYPSEDSQELRVGSARLLPDRNEVWLETLGRERPPFLGVFRDFPLVRLPDEPEMPGKPIRGTVAVADDDHWFNEHIWEVIAVTYFLLDNRHSPMPAEVMTCYPFDLRPKDVSSGGFSMLTKHGLILEAEYSIALYPPLAVRAKTHLHQNFNVNDPHDKALLRCFDDNPRDRLIMAVCHFFRAQFADLFTSPFQQDFATCCAAVEAALGIDAKRDGCRKFVDELTSIYGNSDEHQQFFTGWYASRSIHVHGIPAEAEKFRRTEEGRAYQAFRALGERPSLVRDIARDVIRRQLHSTEDPSGYEPSNSPRRNLQRAIESPNIWRKAKRLLLRTKAADAIDSMSDDDFHVVTDLAIKMADGFSWGSLRNNIDGQHVFKAISTCALLLAKATEPTEKVGQSADELGRAADARDADAVRRWLRNEQHDKWKHAHFACGGRVGILQVLTWALANYFRPWWFR